ncbi:PEP-CTERM sorting domain-containing protein [Thermopirellula anaerolimosa]
MRKLLVASGAMCLLMGLCGSVRAADYSLLFNGHGEFQTDSHNYYYAVTGGKFVNGQTVNGDNASGGVFRFLFDDPDWNTVLTGGAYPLATWIRDDWFPQNAGFAMTLYNGTSIVFDNNGIEDGTYGNYYDNSTSPGNPTPGLYRGYSMSNNFDWIYAGYFKLNEATTVTKIVAYFDGNGATVDPVNGPFVTFNPHNPMIGYAVNIFNSVAGQGVDSGHLMPALTAGFFGDVLSSETVAGSAFRAGSFSVSDTGVKRKFYDASNNLVWEDPIWRLEYDLDSPITLQPGEYFFSHNAKIVPEPTSLIALGALGITAAGWRLARRRKKV